jgi:hypothetical protein
MFLSHQYQFKSVKNIYKIFQRQTNSLAKIASALNQNEPTKARHNEVGIQMISENLREYLFGERKPVNKENIEKARDHLKQFNLLEKNTDQIKDITNNIKLPKLYGANLDEHFKHIAGKYTDKYVKIISKLCSTQDLPKMPTKYNFSSGWTRYDPKSDNFEKVDYPKDDALVFDVEVLVSEGNVPTLAVAVSDKAWLVFFFSLSVSQRHNLLFFLLLKGTHGAAIV